MVLQFVLEESAIGQVSMDFEGVQECDVIFVQVDPGEVVLRKAGRQWHDVLSFSASGVEDSSGSYFVLIQEFAKLAVAYA